MGSNFRIFVFFLKICLSSIFIVHCSPKNDSKDAPEKQLVQIILQQKIALVGDSISAFWPEELLKPLAVTKVAFPNRSSQQILLAVREMNGYFDFCTYNGGVNDFLSDFSVIETARLDQTIDRQKETFQELWKHCGRILILGVYFVEPPWPIFAAPQLNQRMKERISEAPILDLSGVIRTNMLMDGGHLKYEGYRALSENIFKQLNPIR
ncbi:SGNH/GDSL hydrolase family protein [Leptospira sp. FAT2]|uniref:SGNH/GDSL hydrolase family protein n=1 Tax=Leptospira sanjuanensis TaxID=2879643 RepID=UPI001EE8BBFF|nr:SGNH/GDSL hydrolase family protein [Leptospira sanjuanensis]MCG6167126.1 SGNH/GDSL hydrolase family protein [Leptospira sanjuanensis]MCG6192585.1 SGNH/GDSL hydrolase family protein [Leptospira sanjuanensis]